MFAQIPKTYILIKARMLSISSIILIGVLSNRTALAVPNDWNHGCTKSYNQDGNMMWDMPHNTTEGDLLLLFLSRTDDILPLKINGWKYAASCFKSGNKQNQCWTKGDCQTRKKGHCKDFPRGKGRDLATIVFFKTVQKIDLYPNFITYNITGSHAGWGFLLAVNGVDNNKPIRGSNTTSNDESNTSIFPSVNGKEGDLLLLIMAFDDTTNEPDFLPPNGTDLVNFVNGTDEAGYLYAKQLSSNGVTGEMITEGRGGPRRKDALISLVLRGKKGEEMEVEEEAEGVKTDLYQKKRGSGDRSLRNAKMNILW